MDKLYQDLLDNFPDLYIKKNLPLAPLTTLKIGGPADIFIQTTTNLHLIDLLKYLNKYLSKIPITILGNGSNVLISDSGIRGIVIKNLSNQINILNPTTSTGTDQAKTNPISTRCSEGDKNNYLDFASLNYDESNQPKINVSLDAGVQLNTAISKLINMGITGLQWFAYIPATIGGAVWYNIHGGFYHFSQYVKSVQVFNQTNQKIEILDSSQINWGYDFSTFQTNPNLIILSTTLSLYKGDTDKAKQVVETWKAQKAKIQPFSSAGSVFQNPSESTAKKIWGKPTSIGQIIDQELHLKGTKIGQAQISPLHANFIVNTGNATAKDFLALVKLVQDKCQQKYDWQPQLEIKLLGKF